MFNVNTARIVNNAQLTAQIAVVNYLLAPFALVLANECSVGQILAADRTADAALTMLAKAAAELEVMHCSKVSKRTAKALAAALDNAQTVISDHQAENAHDEWQADVAAGEYDYVTYLLDLDEALDGAR